LSERTDAILPLETNGVAARKPGNHGKAWNTILSWVPGFLVIKKALVVLVGEREVELAMVFP